MTEIKPAKQSPRFEGETLKWYVNNTFTVEWGISLTKDDEPLIFDENDEIVFEFYTSPGRELIHEFRFSNIEGNSVNLDFTEEISRKFPIGKYIYCAKFIDHEGTVVTIFAKKKAEVEACH